MSALDAVKANALAPLPVGRSTHPSKGAAATTTTDIERTEARHYLRRIVIWTGLFSVFVNLLMLTGPLFMLQVYDRVLTSGSLPTLAALFGLATLLFLFMGLLDLIRGRLMSRAGAKVESLFDRRLFQQGLAKPGKANTSGLRALEAVRQALSSSGPLAVFDLPWSPLFLGIIFLFHWTMGTLALLAGLLFIGLAFINNVLSQQPLMRAREAKRDALELENSLSRQADVVGALGMRADATERLGRQRQQALRLQMQGQERVAGFSVTTKTLRLFFQSAMLALGAALAINQDITPGMMIAASIIMGRALAPIDQLVAQWTVMQGAIDGWRTLQGSLDERAPGERGRLQLPRPKGLLDIRNLVVAPPESPLPTLNKIDLSLRPGDALGVIGKSASGKSSLARALVGAWPLAAGEIRLDGATLDQYDPDRLGAWLGYLPQDIVLFDGTVGDNIARFGSIDDQAVIEAAQMADAHEMILKLPNGYDTEIGDSGRRLAGGQRQRIALARALYRTPPLLVLDEPNAHLDLEGERAVVAAVERAKAAGQTVVLIAHRPSAIAVCDMILILEQGVQVKFGPRDDVLKATTHGVGAIRERLKVIRSGNE